MSIDFVFLQVTLGVANTGYGLISFESSEFTFSERVGSWSFISIFYRLEGMS